MCSNSCIIILPESDSMGKKQTEFARNAEYWIYLQHAMKMILTSNSTVTLSFSIQKSGALLDFVR